MAHTSFMNRKWKNFIQDILSLFWHPRVPSQALPYDVVALDCEMIYTTGGFRVARVSIIDGSGREVFDQLVRMDDGVHVMSVLLLFRLFCGY